MTKKAWVLALLIVVELFAGARLGADDARQDGLALIARARELEDLRGGGAFEMQGKLAMKLDGKELAGNYKLRWWRTDRWQEEVSLGGFERKRDGVAQGYWQARPLGYQPQVIFDLDRAMDVHEMLKVGKDESVGKTHTRRVNGEELACVDVEGKKKTVQREMCFDPVAGMLRRVEGEISDGLGKPRSTVEYGGSVSIGEKKFPSQIKIERSGRFSAEISIGGVKAETGEAPTAIGAGENGYEFWPSCTDEVGPSFLSGEHPLFPEEARRKRIQGMVALYARVESSGKLTHVTTLAAADPSFEESAKRAVQQWRLTPSMCGEQPVVSETTIEVIFQMAF